MPGDWEGAGHSGKLLRRSPSLDLPRCCAALIPDCQEGLASPARPPHSLAHPARHSLVHWCPLTQCPRHCEPLPSPGGGSLWGPTWETHSGRVSRVPGGSGAPVPAWAPPRLAPMWVRGQEQWPRIGWVEPCPLGSQCWLRASPSLICPGPSHCVPHRSRREPDPCHSREGHQAGSQRLLPISALQGRVRGLALAACKGEGSAPPDQGQRLCSPRPPRPSP